MPTTLTNGVIPDGSVLVREGKRIIGLAVADGPIEIVPVADADSTAFEVKATPDGLRRIPVVGLDTEAKALLEVGQSLESLAIRIVWMLEQYLELDSKCITAEDIQ